MSFEGEVIRQAVAAGSKSEHTAILLRTESGDLILRRKDGNAFKDEVLEALVGRRIRASGRQAGRTLILLEWEELG